MDEAADRDAQLDTLLDGIEQLAHRMADLREQLGAVTHRLDRLHDRLDEMERRRDDELLRRVERELDQGAGPPLSGAPAHGPPQS